MSKSLPPMLQADVHRLAAAELDLAHAARRTADFARHLLPSGADPDSTDGELVQDAELLVEHARNVLDAAIRVDHARRHPPGPGKPSACAGSSTGDTDSRVWTSEQLADSLLDLDSWVLRHRERDDLVISDQPLTDAILRRMGSTLK
jgi:hypothetical protein